MRIAIGSDHAGFALKNEIEQHLREVGHEVLDLGTYTEESVDYPDYAKAVGICGSGVGVSVAANKIPGIRAAICHDAYSAAQGVEHDDMNVLVMGARVVGSALAVVLVDGFLGAVFSGEERHVRRLNKIKAIETEALQGKDE
jgi:ribose 5-phosphate isomerase B